MKTVLISGALGQAAAYLTQQCLERGDKVIGFSRRTSSGSTWRIEEFLDHPLFDLIEGDLTDPSSINSIVQTFKPNEFYNTAAQSHVYTSFGQPALTLQVNTVGVLNCLEAIRLYSPETRFLQYSTSEMFGSSYDRDSEGNKYQDENTCFRPRSPYAVSKVAAHNLVQNYRDAYNLFASTIICFNYEGPKRGENFLTRKVTKWLGRHRDILLSSANLKPVLMLGNLDAYRDWGHAADYMRASRMILAHNKPDDFVVSTGDTFRVKSFVELAFRIAGVEPWERYVGIDESLKRPSEVDFLKGRSSKIQKTLGWKPTINFIELVREMVESDIQQAKLR